VDLKAFHASRHFPIIKEPRILVTQKAMEAFVRSLIPKPKLYMMFEISAPKKEAVLTS
jgi:hypothetical protein